MKKIPLFEPNISNLEKKYVLKSLEKNQISTYGYFKSLFEKKAKSITKSKFNLSTNSGSSALFLALKSLEIGEDEIVLTQSYTFAATTNAIILNKSIPLLLDINLEDLNIDINQLENFLEKKTFRKKKNTFHKQTKKKISCICLVFSLGIIPDLKRIKNISKKYNLKIIFDAACSFGNKFNNNKLSKYCDIATYSFNGNKNFTTGGGGLYSTDIKKYYLKALSIANNGKVSTYQYQSIGYNLRMPSINAAVGLAQLERFNKIIKKKKTIRDLYKKNLKKYQLFNCRFSWGNYLPWMNFCLVKNETMLKKIIKILNMRNIACDYFWIPMHKQNIKSKFILTKFTNTDYIYKKILILPSSTNIKLKNIKIISKIINNI